MSKADEDIYGDIYDTDNNEDVEEFLQEQDENYSSQLASPQAETFSGESSLPPKPTVVAPATSVPPPKDLPAKPVASPIPPKPVSAISNASSLSYSAQIARQFSAYQQTPSQERQTALHQAGATSSSGPLSIPTVDSTANGSADTVYGKKPSEMHDAGKMFIGGLSWDTTDEGLRNYFSEFGKVDACTIMRDPSGRSRGFAFLTFEDPASVNAVVVREHFLDGKAIDPKRAIPREEHLRNTRFFVGGLGPATTVESMKTFFSAYGKVADATVMVDRESGRSKGFGFVTFEEVNNAHQLVGKIGLILDDKEIEVKMAQPRSQRDQTRTSQPTRMNSSTFFSEQEPTKSTPMNIPFVPQQTPMNMMMRPMGQMPMITGGGVPMMNPMGMMGMGMMNGMAGNMGMMSTPSMGSTAMSMGNGMHGGMMGSGMNGMNGMSAGMNSMSANPMNNMAMSGMGGMANMQAMRMGMGGMGTPYAANAQMQNMGMGGMGMMGQRTNVGPTSFNARLAMNSGPGPMRMNNRGQHSFHPYSR